VTLFFLAQEQIDKTLWYPTILGFLVVLAGIGLFCGSTYLLLSTNVGARLGFLIAFTGLMGFMVLLSTLWMITASPLNTLKGSIPQWEVKEVVNDLANAKTAAAHGIATKGVKVDPVEAANVKAAVDAALVTKVPTAVTPVPPGANKYARFGVVTEYMTENTYEVGGSKPHFLNFEFTHQPEHAVVKFCAVETQNVPFGVPPPATRCDKNSDKNGYVVLERNLGSLRFPPMIAFIIAVLLFGLGLLALHWRERDEAETARRAASETESAPPPVPAKV
jgi:hypothetical protein